MLYCSEFSIQCKSCWSYNLLKIVLIKNKSFIWLFVDKLFKMRSWALPRILKFVQFVPFVQSFWLHIRVLALYLIIAFINKYYKYYVEIADEVNESTSCRCVDVNITHNSQHHQHQHIYGKTCPPSAPPAVAIGSLWPNTEPDRADRTGAYLVGCGQRHTTRHHRHNSLPVTTEHESQRTQFAVPAVPFSKPIECMFQYFNAI